YIIKRILIVIPILFLFSIVCFVIIQLPPGDFLTTYINLLRSQGTIITEDLKNSLEVRYGMNQPLIIQYFKWIGRVLQGDLGYSFMWNRSVNELINERLGYTISISLISVLLIWIVAFPLAFYSATHQYNVVDYTFTSISFFGLSIPEFLLSLIFMWLYFEATGKFGGGMYSEQYANLPMSWAKFGDLLNHMWMPFLVIIITGTAGLFKTFRANLIDELGKPYVLTARAKGVPYGRLLLKYPTRIALIPFISTVGWMLPGLISGQTILSIIMNLPTVGPLLYSALKNQDMFLAGSIVLILGALTMIGTMISDILLAVTDPRTRNEL
ncbi:MAG: ABC transporter permease, partial [Chloroflexi bacterium]|nr:ABC transporter permease [Chloroflexota bacterium]